MMQVLKRANYIGISELVKSRVRRNVFLGKSKPGCVALIESDRAASPGHFQSSVSGGCKESGFDSRSLWEGDRSLIVSLLLLL